MPLLTDTPRIHAWGEIATPERGQPRRLVPGFQRPLWLTCAACRAPYPEKTPCPVPPSRTKPVSACSLSPWWAVSTWPPAHSPSRPCPRATSWPPPTRPARASVAKVNVAPKPATRPVRPKANAAKASAAPAKPTARPPRPKASAVKASVEMPPLPAPIPTTTAAFR
ncbi:hypothetical protein FQZ97_1031680 [compost metagenome]